MTRFGVTVALTAAGWAATAGPAAAQVMRAFVPGIGPVSLVRFQTYSFQQYNPYLGVTTSYSSVNLGPPRGAVYNTGGYFSGSVATAYTGPQYTSQARAVSRAQRAGRAMNQDADARAAIAGQWDYERGAKPAQKAAPLPAAVDKGLLAADPELIASGEALNGLLAAMRPLEQKALRPVDASLIPPDLAARIVFDGGPPADAANLLRAGVLDFPAPLQDPALEPARDELNRAFALVTEVVGHNRAAVVAAADKLSAAVAKARDAAVPVTRDLPIRDAIAAAHFFNRVSAVADVLRDQDLAGVFVPGWSAVGVSVKELVRHMARFKLTFGPATDPAAYDAVHRGLGDYYVGLARAGNK